MDEIWSIGAITSFRGNPTAEFWTWFKTEAPRLGKTVTYDRGTSENAADSLAIEKAVREVGERARTVNPAFGALIGSSPAGNELIVTAYGDSQEFDSVDRCVASAPVLPGWQFTALKPGRTFSPEMEIRSGSVQFRIADLRFRSSRNPDGKVDVTVYFANNVADDSKGFANLARRLVEDSLGERYASKTLGDVVALSRPETIDDTYREFTNIQVELDSSGRIDSKKARE